MMFHWSLEGGGDDDDDEDYLVLDFGAFQMGSVIVILTFYEHDISCYHV
jgi:hypothetical protein